MILLDYHNKIIEDTLLDKFNNPPGPDGKWEYFEMILADFDGVTFHLSTDQNQKNVLRISVSIKCFGELKYVQQSCNNYLLLRLYRKKLVIDNEKDLSSL